MIRVLAALLLLSSSAWAQAVTDTYGRTIIFDGLGTCSVPGLAIGCASASAAVNTFNSMAPSDWKPPVVAPTTIDPLAFIARLTPTEQLAVTTAAQSNAQVMLFLMKLTGATTVNVTDPLTIAGTQAMVSAGLLTAARAAQILDLTQVSP